MTLYPFSQIAANITVRVEPSDTDLERYVGLEHLDPESLKLRRWGSPSDVIGQKLKFWKGDIIYGKRRAYQRKLAVADFDGICSAHAMVLRAKPEVCLPEFLPFFLQSDLFHNRALEISVGSLSPTINWTTLAKQEFPLPPVDEQRRIADLLWAADDAIQRQDELINAALVTKKSFIEKIFSNVEVREVGEYAQSVTSGSRWWAKYYSESGDIFIRVANLTRESPKIDLTDLQYVTPPDGAEMERTKLQTGDLLISVTADLGRIGVVSEDFPRAFMSQHVALVRLRTDQVIPEYVAYSLLSSSGQKQFHKLNDAGAKAGMNLQNVRRLKFAWQPYEQQIKVMEKFKAFEETIETARQHLENQKELKKQLLNKTLSV
jgi:restriction endonuclease S subunit